MKVDSKVKFHRIITNRGPVDGEFTIQKGSGELVGLFFVVGTADVKDQSDGAIVQQIDVIYPYDEVRSFVLEIRTLSEEQ